MFMFVCMCVHVFLRILWLSCGEPLPYNFVGKPSNCSIGMAANTNVAKVTAPRPPQAAGVAASTAAQPAAKTYQSLRTITSKQCAKMAEFKTVVFEPWEDTYSYD